MRDASLRLSMTLTRVADYDTVSSARRISGHRQRGGRALVPIAADTAGNLSAAVRKNSAALVVAAVSFAFIVGGFIQSRIILFGTFGFVIHLAAANFGFENVKLLKIKAV